MGKQRFLYGEYVQTLSERYEANLSYIQCIYGFDAGREFDVTVFKMLGNTFEQLEDHILGGLCRHRGRRDLIQILSHQDIVNAHTRDNRDSSIDHPNQDSENYYR